MSDYISIPEKFNLKTIELKGVNSIDLVKDEINLKDFFFKDIEEIKLGCERKVISFPKFKTVKEKMFWFRIFMNSDLIDILNHYESIEWDINPFNSDYSEYQKSKKRYRSFMRLSSGVSLDRVKEFWKYYKNEKMRLNKEIDLELTNTLNHKNEVVVKEKYPDYINYTIRCIHENKMDIHDIFEWKFLSNIKSEDIYRHFYSKFPTYLRNKLKIKHFIINSPLSVYVNSELFNFYVEVWNNGNIKMEPVENLIIFKKLFVFCFDYTYTNHKKNDYDKKGLGEDNMQRELFRPSGLENDNIFNNPYYDDNLDLDQQHPDFWDSLD